MKSLYLILDIATIAPTLAFSFHPKLQFNRVWHAALPAIFSIAILFIAWDLLYTHLGVWGFNEEYHLDLFVGNLPLEEVLFFVCIPYACLFTYFCIWHFHARNYLEGISRRISILFILGLMVMASIYHHQLYTCVVSILLAACIFLLEFIWRSSWLSRFYISYLYLLIPFGIVNGILTGSGLKKPVVWYQSNEIMGLRCLTIPAEDFLYCMLMLLSVVAVYERLLQKKAKALSA